MQKEEGGKTQKAELGIKIRFRMTDRGDILSIDLDAPPEISGFASGLLNTLKSMVPSLPKEPIGVGDALYEMDSTINSQGKPIHFLITAHVAGSTQHRGRAALVVNYGGTVSKEGKKIKISGFGLQDFSTGEWVLSDMLMHNKIVHTRIIMKIDLPIIASNTSNITPQISPSGKVEPSLRKLKQLLEKGLITPDEAATKRKEILDRL